VTGPAFSLPPPPAGWAGADLVRLVDPTGDAIAWIVPGRGALCAAFHVRGSDGQWQQVLGAEPDSDEGRGIAIGGEIAALHLLTRDPTSCALVLANQAAHVDCAILERRLVFEVCLGSTLSGSRVSVSLSSGFEASPLPIEVTGDIVNVETRPGAVAGDATGTMTVRIG
jgi:hypothetical protein